MISLFRLVQIILGPPGDYFFLMGQIISQHIQKVHHLWLVIYQSQHDHSEGILQLGMFVQLVQNHIGIGIPAQFNHHPNAFPVGFVPDIYDPIHFLQLYQFRDLYNQIGLVHHIGQF